MDKTCIIILLLVIIVIAIFYKKDKNIQSNNFDQRKNVINKINQLKDNQYKESFNISEKNLFSNKENINDLPNGKGDYPNRLLHTKPILVEIKANKGDDFLTLTSFNNINTGDMIIINPQKKNSEINYVVGIGNNIVRLNTPLKNNHFPNEGIINKYNDNSYPTPSRFTNVGYGEIDPENGNIEFSPDDNTWGFNVNLNEQVIDGWCGPDSQFIKNSKFPNCIKECKQNTNCNAIRWVNETNDCSLMESCNNTNNDKKWKHMYFDTPSFTLGDPNCSSETEPLDRIDCQKVANAQNMTFHKLRNNNQRPGGCFQYQDRNKKSIAHNSSTSTYWPNNGYKAIQYCK